MLRRYPCMARGCSRGRRPASQRFTFRRSKETYPETALSDKQKLADSGGCEKMLHGKRTRNRRPLARPSRARRLSFSNHTAGGGRAMTDPRPDPVFNDEAEVLAVLQRLVGQLKGSGYRDREGHPIENNEAFMDAVALLELHGKAPK